MNRSGDSPPPADRRINFAFTRDVASDPAASSGAIPSPPARTFRRYPPERMRPGQQIPVTIAQSATLFAGDDMAIWINGFTVYDRGLAFRIEGRIRNSTRPTQDSATLLGPLNVGRMTRPHSNGSIQLTLTFHDGTTVTSVGSNQLVPDDPTAPWLDGGGALQSPRLTRRLLPDPTPTRRPAADRDRLPPLRYPGHTHHCRLVRAVLSLRQRH